MCLSVNFRRPSFLSYLRWCNRISFLFLFIIAINFLSEGKEFGRSAVIAKYSSNYQFNCSATGCSVAPEFRTSMFGLRPIINKKELTEYLEIPFVDDLWPKLLCAAVPTDYKPKELMVTVKFSSNSGTGQSVFEILNGKKECINYNSEEKIDSISIDVIKPDFDYLSQRANELLLQGNHGSVDDQKRFFEVKFRLEYSNKFFALTFIWLIAIFIALKLVKSYVKLRDEFAEFMETGGEPNTEIKQK